MPNRTEPGPRVLTESKRLQERAERVLPGGVDSPVRAFRAVGGDPPFIVRAQGARLYDADGYDYLDYVGSWGPMVLGHAFPPVVNAIEKAAQHGASFGASTSGEVELAELIVSAFPGMDKLRFVSSGTEATMSAIRLARAYTKRKHIIKFEGCYHGHADSLLVKAGSGVATLGIPGSAGVPDEFAQLTIALPYNDIDAVKKTFAAFRKQIACVIVEPIVGNMGCVPPAPGYLEGLRDLTAANGALLIFDEVMTGFRVAWGGAQRLYNLQPDLTTLGKIIGGGLPVGAYGGPAKIMDMVAPLGPVYQAGTLSGNPLAMSAGLATLQHLNEHNEVYEHLETLSEKLVDGILNVARQAGVPMTANRVGSMFTWFFQPGNVWDWSSAEKSDTAFFGEFHRRMLESGVWLPPSQFEAAFLSGAHTNVDVQVTIDAAAAALKS